jgi:glycerol-3-phosphate O-acyltransferase/dihydroxyacetone phosphate acyltransferase
LPRTYRVLRSLVRLLLGAFFRRIEVSGLENVPETGGGLVVAWHPNALVDPALIFISFPRQIVFGARHGIFDWPIIGRIVRIMGTIPIYRAEDRPAADADSARRQANEASLDAMAEAIGEGRFAALFPEGLSHDEPTLKTLKTGAARIYYRVAARGDTGSAAILPVGLHYDKKGLLGSSVLILYHPPLDVPPALATPELDPQSDGIKVRALTSEIEHSLKNIVYATENWKVHFLLHRARKLVRAERAARAGRILKPPTMAERVLAFRRLWTGFWPGCGSSVTPSATRWLGLPPDSSCPASPFRTGACWTRAFSEPGPDSRLR